MAKKKKLKSAKRFRPAGHKESVPQMNAAQLQKRVDEAIQYHQQGRIDLAEPIYDEVLQQDPNNPDGLHLKGMILNGRGEREAGLAMVKKAIQSSKIPFAMAENTLGLIYQDLSDFEKAEQSFKKALKMDPPFAPACLNLARMYVSLALWENAKDYFKRYLAMVGEDLNILMEYSGTLHELGQFEEAEALYQKMLAMEPTHIPAINNYAVVKIALKQPEAALQMVDDVLQRDPDYIFAWNNKGLALKDMGRAQEAIAAFDHTVSLRADFADAYLNKARILEEQGLDEEAFQVYATAREKCPNYIPAYQNAGILAYTRGIYDLAEELYQKALEVEPNSNLVHTNLAALYRDMRQFDLSEKHARIAIDMAPGYVDTYNTLGWVLHDMGRHAEAEQAFRAGLAQDPLDMKIHSNLAFLCTYQRQFGHQQLFDEHAEFGRRHTGKPKLPLNVDRNPDRPLRVGYVSPDFRKHVVRNFIQPIIENHDASRVEVYCYAQVSNGDEITQEFQNASQGFVFTTGLNTEELAAQIRADKIDILIDIAGHSGGNRLDVFFHKPAPIQAAYLGYITTTGVPEIDYRISDEIMNPDGSPELYSEQIYHLPRCYKVYMPNPDEPPVNLDVSPAGEVIFGSLNRISKLPRQTIELWSDVLKALPHSKLLIARHELKFDENREEVYGMFDEFQISRDRLILDDTSDVVSHMEIYGRIDIALDPIPVVGGATTCEALWMGCPVLTLQGETFRERISSTLLDALGMKEWISTSREDYIAKAVSLANDYEFRKDLRAKQRDLFRNSALFDYKGMAETMENAFRDMWRKYLAKG